MQVKSRSKLMKVLKSMAIVGSAAAVGTLGYFGVKELIKLNAAQVKEFNEYAEKLEAKVILQLADEVQLSNGAVIDFTRLYQQKTDEHVYLNLYGTIEDEQKLYTFKNTYKAELEKYREYKLDGKNFLPGLMKALTEMELHNVAINEVTNLHNEITEKTNAAKLKKQLEVKKVSHHAYGTYQDTSYKQSFIFENVEIKEENGKKFGVLTLDMKETQTHRYTYLQPIIVNKIIMLMPQTRYHYVDFYREDSFKIELNADLNYTNDQVIELILNKLNSNSSELIVTNHMFEQFSSPVGKSNSLYNASERVDVTLEEAENQNNNNENAGSKKGMHSNGLQQNGSHVEHKNMLNQSEAETEPVQTLVKK